MGQTDATEQKKDYSVFPQGRADRFPVERDELFELLDQRDARALTKLGGVKGVIEKLETDPENGLPDSEVDQQFADRKTQFGINFIPPAKRKSYISLWIGALNDLTMIILIVCSVVSLILGIVELDQDPLGWVDGCAILIAVVIVATVTATNDYSKEKQFEKLNAQKVDRQVKVIRGGKHITISVHEVVVGDICEVEAGDAIPADGLFISGTDASVDESAMTGETDHIKKNEENPFVLSGTCLAAGRFIMVATGVGPSSQWGEILKKLGMAAGQTPLQVKLDQMAKIIGFVGMGFAGATFLALIIRWCIEQAGLETGGFEAENFMDWIDFFITAITIIVVAVPEGLPLAVTISLAYSMKRMLQDQNFVRKLEACETMGGCQWICSDKTGTLTMNKMSVVRLVTGSKDYNLEQEVTQTPSERLSASMNPVLHDLLLAHSCINSTSHLLPDQSSGQLICIGNKTEGALLYMADHFGVDYEKIREKAPAVDEVLFSSDRKRMSRVINLETAHLADDFPAMTESLRGEASLRCFTKGASEIVFGMCTRRINDDGVIVPMDDEYREYIANEIANMASGCLRTLVLAYRDVDSHYLDEERAADAQANPEEAIANKERYLEHDLIFHALVGIKDPLRPTVKNAIERVHHAGIVVVMVTGDNIETGSAIAKECGIYNPDDGDIAILGPDFRKMSDEEVDKIAKKIRVMARSSPSDKYRLVKHLKDKFGLVVAVTGDGTNDAPALNAADVGLAMGISGTEVAKSASDIVILDDRFDSIVKALEWGRTVMSNIRKFLQFQLTVNVVALVTTFLGSVSTGFAPFNAVQLLYVNLIMDSLGSLALATEGPVSTVLDALPVGRNDFLLTPKMLRNMGVQIIYQLILCLTLVFAGQQLFGIESNYNWVASLQGDETPAATAINEIIMNEYGDRTEAYSSDDVTQFCSGTPENLKQYYNETAGADQNELEMRVRQYMQGCDSQYVSIYANSIMYNSFIWAQMANEFNCRRIGNEINIFSNLLPACWIFIAVVAACIVFHILLFQFGGLILDTIPVSVTEYFIGLGLGLVSIPLGMLGRLIPAGDRIVFKPKADGDKKTDKAKSTKHRRSAAGSEADRLLGAESEDSWSDEESSPIESAPANKDRVDSSSAPAGGDIYS